MKRRAFDELFRMHYNEAMLYVCSLTHNRAIAEDVVSEGFLRAIKSIDPDRDGFKYWLFKVCRNCYFDYFKKSKQLVEVPDQLADDEDELVDRLIEKEEYRALYRALSLLNENYREAIRLFYFGGMSVKEIAGIMDTTPDNVKVMLFRARNKLKTILEEQNDF